MCLHRGCGKRRSQKCQRTRQGREVWELVTGIGSSCFQFPFTEFFDSSCYQMIQVRFRIFSIAAAMGHRYENSALDPSVGRPNLHDRTIGAVLIDSFCKPRYLRPLHKVVCLTYGMERDFVLVPSRSRSRLFKHLFF